MRIVVNRASVSDGLCRVEFCSERGKAWAYWHGESPSEGSAHDVEVDLPSEEIVSLAAAPGGATRPTVGVGPDGTIAVRGTVIGADGGCLSLQFGDDILLVDTVIPAPADGAHVVVQSRSMHLYPFTT